MIKMLSDLLMTKDTERFNRFRILKNLLVYTAENYGNFEVKDEYLVGILDDYINEREHIKKNNGILEEITEFYEELIILYKDGKFGRFNFLVEKYKFKEDLKKWLKEYKEEILSFFRFYIENQGLELLNVIYSNKYFKVIRIQAEEREYFLTPYIHPQEIVIRILLDGRIYYKEGLLLEKNQYIIAGPLGFLGGWKILPSRVNLVIITIKKEFLEKFNLIGLDRVIHVPLTLHQEELLKNLNEEYLKKNPFYLIEVVTFFLQINNFFSEKIEPISAILNKKVNWLKMVEIVDESIEKNMEEIENKVCEELKIKRKTLDEIIYLYEKTTFQKFIYNKKVNKIIEEYLIGKRNVDELLEKYKIKNKLIFRYNLEKFYNISIRELKYIQDSLKENK